MSQHPVQVHVTLTGPINMAIRTYVRDEKGWGCRAEVIDNESGKVIEEREFEMGNTAEAVFDALRSLVDGFAMLMLPGEEIPELIPMARTEYIRQTESN